jgi:hypothetical protein
MSKVMCQCALIDHVNAIAEIPNPLRHGTAVAST